MKISVVTVCFNSAATIGWTVESFLEQDWPDKELLIVDGVSRDETLKIVQGFDHPSIRVSSEPDKGIYDAMNKGLRTFSGDAVGFLNSDDRYRDAGALTAIAETLAEHDVAYADIDIVADHDSRRLVRAWRNTPYRPGGFRRGWMPAHPGFYVRRSVVEAVGEFDLTWPSASDYDWMLRAMELNDFRAGHVPHVVVDMANGGYSSSGIRAFLRGNMQSLQVRRRRLGTGLLDRALFAKPLRKIPQWLGRSG